MTAEGRRPLLSLVVKGAVGPAARHGLRELRRALQGKSIPFEETSSLTAIRGSRWLVAGIAGASRVVDELVRDVRPPSGPEALLIRHAEWNGREGLIVAGSDDRGLMYALLDVADRVGWASDAADPFAEVRDVAESPDVPERALSIYTMHRAHFESTFHNEAYWERYLSLLARSRFNTFALLFAYESSGYFAPPYPYFLDVDAFPDVHVVGLTSTEQQRNLAALNRLIEMTHAHGLSFTLGIWDHIYRGGVQRGPDRDETGPLPWRVSGVTTENLLPYTTAALSTFLRRVPNLDAIQFRMHGESGLTHDEMGIFWAAIFDVMNEHGKGIRFDLRVKECPDSIIDLALEKGVPIRLCTKYWMEQMGMPFHPTHIHPRNQHDRRHSYADLLRKPQRYRIHWRLWNGGTTRVLLWGDPEYVRRFAASTHLYDGEGFEVNEPLATKMAGHPHDREPFSLLNPPYRASDWEFERYWHFFQVFGRVGYNPNTPSEVWDREFERRFGPDAAPAVARGLHRASRILPRIVAYNYPYHLFPTTRGWIEKQRMEDLPKYAAALPSDTAQFLSFEDAARAHLTGEAFGRRHPLKTSAWFARIADEVLAAVAEAEAQIGSHRGPEFVATTTDLRILAHLARYHSRRIPAGLSWALFRQSHDLNALDDAIHHEAHAIDAWETLVAAAGDVYADDLMMGVPEAGLGGHWSDELAALRRGLVALREEREAFTPSMPDGGPAIWHVPIRRSRPGAELVIRATVCGGEKVEGVCVRVGSSPDETVIALEPAGRYLYRGVVPASVIAAGQRYRIEARDEAGNRAVFPDDAGIPVRITDDDDPPVIVHDPIETASASRPLTVSADVRDPSGVKWVRLRYRSVTQYEDYRTLDMGRVGNGSRYEAIVPAEHVDPAWDFMYFIEAVDGAGNGTIYPDLDDETPYVVVQLEQDAGP